MQQRDNPRTGYLASRIGNAEVAVLQDKSEDPERSRASVQGVLIHGKAQRRRPLLLHDMRQDAIHYIGWRHIDKSAPAMTRSSASAGLVT